MSPADEAFQVSFANMYSAPGLQVPWYAVLGAPARRLWLLPSLQGDLSSQRSFPLHCVHTAAQAPRGGRLKRGWVGEREGALWCKRVI
jgi:hypothetical protein